MLLSNIDSAQELRFLLAASAVARERKALRLSRPIPNLRRAGIGHSRLHAAARRQVLDGPAGVRIRQTGGPAGLSARKNCCTARRNVIADANAAWICSSAEEPGHFETANAWATLSGNPSGAWGDAKLLWADGVLLVLRAQPQLNKEFKYKQVVAPLRQFAKY